MDCEDGAKKELQGVVVGVRKSKGFPLGGSGTSLASMEFLSMPQVQEVVLSADMQCEKCQKRVTDIIAKMNGAFDSQQEAREERERVREMHTSFIRGGPCWFPPRNRLAYVLA
ncbi:hypothetical protein GmHk_01G001046 [Glycine max]|uniref:uncharacterized protein LOC114413357 isoform X2 n=1 Tax=Glycine soja TaxID=3848 RepID=UPI00023BBABC|nr:uncharacterized protein LOC114413357 isoform X2 [Glycine soja]KAH1265317.1 hypothetical protein GmHk_01G001046 [Glycine max]|eukprot:XP_006573241.1 uncharacterized protein LOC100811739 isoform X2 [Glycine max]